MLPDIFWDVKNNAGTGDEINSLRNLCSFAFVFAIRIRSFDTGKWTRAKTLLRAQIKRFALEFHSHNYNIVSQRVSGISLSKETRLIVSCER